MVPYTSSPETSKIISLNPPAVPSFASTKLTDHPWGILVLPACQQELKLPSATLDLYCSACTVDFESLALPQCAGNEAAPGPSRSLTASCLPRTCSCRDLSQCLWPLSLTETLDSCVLVRLALPQCAGNGAWPGPSHSCTAGCPPRTCSCRVLPLSFIEELLSLS